MSLYLVTEPFVDIRFGAFHAGEIIDLPDEQAQTLPYVMRVRKEPPMETADLYLENLETAHAKPVRKGRNNAHPTRQQ